MVSEVIIVAINTGICSVIGQYLTSRANVIENKLVPTAYVPE